MTTKEVLEINISFYYFVYKYEWYTLKKINRILVVYKNDVSDNEESNTKKRKMMNGILPLVDAAYD